MSIKRKVVGHKYYSGYGDDNFQVETDYLNGKIYLSPPQSENGLRDIKDLANATLRAVQDMKKEFEKEK